MQKILLIEDDAFLGDVLLEKMKKEGYDSHLAREGDEGLRKIKELKPDLILLDILLPKMNGYEILEAKQKDPDIKGIPVIVISNSGQPVEINRALALGVKDYFVKAQFDPEEVMFKVKNFLRKAGDVDFDISDFEGKRKNSNKLKGKKIMWVEDDSFLSDIIARKLSSEEAILLHAQDGEKALAVLEEEKPDVILLDILLPGMSGFELLEKLKSDEKLKNTPIILLSNLGQESDVEKGKKLGADRFLIKASLTLDEIIEQIEQVIINSEK